jgi:hypothetical protein
MTRAYSIAFKQKLIERLTGKEAAERYEAWPRERRSAAESVAMAA